MDEPIQQQPPPPSFWTLLAAALASSGLLYLAFFPVSWGWLGWFALVPYCFLVRAPGRPPRLYLAAWLGALPFYFGVLWWLSVANIFMAGLWVFLALYGSLAAPLVLYVLRAIDRGTRLPLTLTLPVAVVCLEYARANFLGGFVTLLLGSYQHDFPGGFAWYLLGHTQHDFLEMIQIADLGGAYAVSFVVAAVNGLLAEIVLARLASPEQQRYRPVGLLVQALAVLPLLLGSLGYGVWQLSRETMSDGPRVALLQGSVPQRIRDQGHFQGGDARETQAKHYARLASRAAPNRPDLIIWPETSGPGMWWEVRPGKPLPECTDLAADIMRRWPAAHLLGMNTAVYGMDGKIREYNAGILIAPKQGHVGRYDKVHRVPFGEFVPFADRLPFLSYLTPNAGEYGISAGEGFPRFTVPDTEHTFGVLICYEDSVPALARAYVSDHPADFLVNISNDGWWDGTFGHDQHLAVARFRAVECRRSIARAVNMGISAIVDANGRVLAPAADTSDVPLWTVPERAGGLSLSRWSEFRKRAGVIVGTVPVDSRTSVYARYGDWLPGVLFLILAVTFPWRRGPGP